MNNVFLFRLRRLCAFLIGVVFLLAGIFKLLDPVGAGLVMEGYFRFFHVTFLLPTAKATAVVLALAEAILGAAMISGVWRKQVAIITTAMIVFFTVLTLFLAIFNPVSLTDCGCFGEALVLTNGQTLAKNIVLLLCSLFLTRYPLYLHRLISERNQWVISIYAWVYAAGVCYASFRNLPVLEFTPYTVGADLRGAVEGTAKTDDGGISPLANFYLNTPQGDDCTFEVLADTSWQFLLIAPNCATADDGCCDRINSLYDYCVDKGYAFRMATASAPQDIYDWIDRTGAAYPILLADETELKSAVRANPGLMLLHDGRIAAKWSNNNLPEYRDEDDIATNVPTSSTSPLTRMLLWFIVPLIIIIFLDGLWVGSKYYKRYRIRKRIFSKQQNPKQ